MQPGSSDPPPALRLRGISKRFGTLQANRDIGLELKKGQVLALLGENGAGKTTLMNILFGHYVADSGTIEVEGHPLPAGSPAAAIEAGIGMVHQHFTLADNLTVLDNVILGTESLWSLYQQRDRARRRLLDLSDRFGLAVDPNALVGTLSVGEQQRVELLKALYRDARILILDEPTAVLTPQETEALFETLRGMVSEGLSAIFISHKLQEVLSIADRIVVLRGGEVVGEFGSDGVNRATLAETMVGREIKAPSRSPMATGSTILELRNVSVSLPHSSLREVNLTVRGHEILGIAGVSGNGQVAFADLLSGLAIPDSGELHILGERAEHGSPARMIAAGVGRIPEDRHGKGVVGDMNVCENLVIEDYRAPRFSTLGWLNARAILEHAHELLHRYDVRCASASVPARSLSGGNMQKLILARVLSREPRLILASQPTRGLDVGAASYVHEQLLEARQRGSAVILISEDLDELLALSDRIAVIFRGHLSAPLPREDVDLGQLGLLMSGHTDNKQAPHAA